MARPRQSETGSSKLRVYRGFARRGPSMMGALTPHQLGWARRYEGSCRIEVSPICAVPKNRAVELVPADLIHRRPRAS
jgi:hypothetical protein